MERNKITTYLLYAIGEIILVVVGILIAVSIDNWNQSKNDQKKELSYLISYASDLQKNISELDRVINKSGTTMVNQCVFQNPPFLKGVQGDLRIFK